ncbi:hypothetical protein ACOSQ4_029435 [Xanthoceras sorbifolium]
MLTVGYKCGKALLNSVVFLLAINRTSPSAWLFYLHWMVRVGPYERLEKIGKGTYGEVYKGQHLSNNETVALKRIRKHVPGAEITEISLLQGMQHENIVRLLDVQKTETDLYLIFEYLDMDFKKYMKSYPDFGKDPRNIKTFLHQILRGIAYCHSRRVLHRDLKPKNLLVDLCTNTLKLADFGLAREFSITFRTYTPKVGTRLYRAPEILLGSTDYSTPVDVWAVGCIFAEMVNLKPLFPGKSQIEQLHMIFSMLGTPNEDTWPGVTCLPDFRLWSHNFTSKDLATVVPNLEPSGVDLLSKMLCMDPNKRITVQSALEHEYFTKDGFVH